jgi:UDPglucose--hexose-1-phosphate uridylyltransferase
MPADTPSRDPRIHAHGLTARTVVVAPRRADRPHDVATPRVAEAACPFCVGHEALTPPAVLESPPTAAGPWQVRIIPNRYPIVEPLGHAAALPIDTRPAHGLHEVVVESPAHDRSILDVPPERWRAVWDLVRRRLAMLAERRDLSWATVFKNSGPRAGSSLEHLHSQLVGLDFVPPLVAVELDAAALRPDPFGDLIHQAEAGDCIVATAGDLVALVPPALRQPFETWILPRVRAPHFHAAEPAHATALADLTRDVISRLETVSPGVDFNWWLHQAPFAHHPHPAADRWHWHLEIVPRLAQFAGFELGTGCHISTLSARDSARALADAARSS